jgi:phage terminase large subunit
VAWVEEAQTLSARRDGSELWFTWNPRRGSDPVDEFFRGEKAQTARKTARAIRKAGRKSARATR